MLSIVIPIYNEEGLIDDLVKRTVSALESFITDYEIIFVDDGSDDRSLQYLLNWQIKNQGIKVLSLSKNFGHQAAFTAGLEHSSGQIVGMMDGDLQDPPELLGEMYRKINEEDYDIISGTRNGRIVWIEVVDCSGADCLSFSLIDPIAQQDRAAVS